MTIEETKALLRSDVLAEVQKGIAEFAKYVKENSSRKENATYAFFELPNKKGSTKFTKIELLETVITKFEDQLDTESLVKIIQATLNNSIYDNFEVTLQVIQILVNRKDVAGQNAVVESFKQACCYYDAGHRAFEGTVQDQLLDDFFPEFEGEPLANLLLWCNSDHLCSEYGDGMDALFKPAFEKIEVKALEDKLVAHFIEYAKEQDEDYLDYSLRGFEDISPKVQAILKKIKQEVANYHNEENETPLNELEDADDLFEDTEDVGQEEDLDAITKRLETDSENLKIYEKQNLLNKINSLVVNADVSSIINYIATLPKIADKEFRDMLVSGVLNGMNSKLKQQKLEEAKSILTAYTNCLPIIGFPTVLATGNETSSKIDIRQGIASDAVVLAVFMKDAQVFEMAEKLIPENVSNAVLAFNLSCYHAVNKNKEKLLHFTNLSLNLGKTPEQFIKDSDFAPYLQDADFMELLD